MGATLQSASNTQKKQSRCLRHFDPPVEKHPAELQLPACSPAAQPSLGHSLSPSLKAQLSGVRVVKKLLRGLLEEK